MTSPTDEAMEICRSCGTPVWPEYDGQPHRNCDNCGTRVWFEEWAKEKFGSNSSPPRHAVSELPFSERTDSDEDDTTRGDSKQTSWDDFTD